jgi:cytoskeletal protein RodZ
MVKLVIVSALLVFVLVLLLLIFLLLCVLIVLVLLLLWNGKGQARGQEERATQEKHSAEHDLPPSILRRSSPSTGEIRSKDDYTADAGSVSQ